MSRNYLRNKGFTLVELLVVLAIILILAALLFPAIFATRARARSLACQSNLKQIGLAIIQYADQNNGIFPPFRWNDPGTAVPINPPPMVLRFGEERIIVSRPRWNLLIGPYIEGSIDTDILDPDGDGIPNFNDDHTPFGNPVFICPDASERNTSRNGSYGYNYQFLGHARQFRNGIARPYGKPWIKFPVSQGSISSNHRTVLVADTLGTASALPENQRQPWSGETNLCAARGNHSYALDPPVPFFRDASQAFVMGHVSSGGCENATGGFSGVDARHSNGRANIVFADGHTGSMTPEELGYVVRLDGSYAYRNLAELFQDLNGNGIPDRKDEWIGTNKWFSGAGIHKLLPLQWR